MWFIKHFFSTHIPTYYLDDQLLTPIASYEDIGMYVIW